MARQQLRQPRLADMVADRLRARILSGELPDGSKLPKQEELLDEFRVSSPSVREALRILETEGLVTVQRGNVGGAVVHEPKADSAAFMLAMVLERRRVTLDQVIDAIGRLEPICAAACAERRDRSRTVLPSLATAIGETTQALNDAEIFARCARTFHEQLVAVCGNEPLILVVGAIEGIWSSQFGDEGSDRSLVILPDKRAREKALERHRQIYSAVEAGDALEAERIVRQHYAGLARSRAIGRDEIVRARRIS